MSQQQDRWISRARAVVAAAAVAGLLAACGGSAQDVATQSVVQVDGRVQPASVDQGVASIKSRSSAAAPTPAMVALGSLPGEKSLAAAAGGGTGPRQVGAARDVVETRTSAQTQQQLQWKPTANGGQVAAISFSAQDAHGLRLGVLVGQLPGSAQLRVYRRADPGTVFQVSGQEVLQRIESNARAGDTSEDGRTWWTPDVGASEVTLEVELPPGTPPSALDIAVPRVSHIFENLAIPTAEELAAKINESATCHLDATCHDTYANQRNAVARMIFTSAGNSYVCTGTLLNDSQSSGTPYFLTANHCISSQAAASTLQTDWFYRAPTCNSRTLSNATARRLNGAALLYASQSTDTALLRLNDTPPAGAFFAGWDAGAQSSGTAVVGLHHPKGDLLKLSVGALSGQANCVTTGATTFQCSGSSGNFYRLGWTQGTTEGGSSGSAIFKNGTQVIGTLYGGSASCSALSGTEFYGRFDVAYNAALKNWLGAAGGSGSGGDGGAAARLPVYRFHNTAGQEHYYTSSVAERDILVSQYAASFIYEGVVFYTYPSQGSNLFPTYRLVDVARKAHLYTADPLERDAALRSSSAVALEGIAWWSRAQPGSGSVPVYRYFNRVAGTHFYTASDTERAYVNEQLSQYYQLEGIAFYVWPNP